MGLGLSEENGRRRRNFWNVFIRNLNYYKNSYTLEE
jgi:hypothetical protein